MKKVTLYNFHSHTYRCGHAYGEDEEYIINAIKEGFKYYGISDHVMFPFIEQPNIRGHYPIDYPSYLNSFKQLKDRYGEYISLHLGMEAEYSPYLKEYYLDLLRNDLEYLICGQHFYVDSTPRFYNYSDFPFAAERYVKDVIDAIKSGIFLYICHPDQIVYHYHNRDEYLYNLCKQIILAAKEYNVPLELNISKVEEKKLNGDIDPFKNASFPLDMFWEIAGQEQVDVIIGLDTHHPIYVNKNGFKDAYEYAKKYNLKIMNPTQIENRILEIRKKILG